MLGAISHPQRNHKCLLLTERGQLVAADTIARIRATARRLRRRGRARRGGAVADIDEWMEEREREWKAESQRREEIRQARIPKFDGVRHSARLRLLEAHAALRYHIEERDELASLDRYPMMPDEKRNAEIAEHEHRIGTLENELADLRAAVGDPDAVIDEYGQLPADRRQMSLTKFRIRCENRVRELRRSMSEAQSQLAVKGLDRTERRKIKLALETARGELDALLAVPPLTEAEMCSECPTPQAWHGFKFGGPLMRYMGPCHGWPGWAQRIAHVRKMLDAMAAKQRTTPPEPPKPKPLATIPSGLPISEVMERLTRIQAEHPNAEVRRGARNKWEIWPAQ